MLERIVTKVKTFLENEENRKILIISILSRVLIVVIGIIGFYIFPTENVIVIDGAVRKSYMQPSQEHSLDFYEIFARWDTRYYLEIAKVGYSQAEGEDEMNNDWAFMPAYPILIRTFSLFGTFISDNYLVIVGMGISNVLFVISCFFISELTKKLGFSRYTLHIIALICLYPGSVYFSFAYTESLFLFLSILGYYLLREKKWFLACLSIGLLSITRKPGVLLGISYVVEFFYSYRKLLSARNVAKFIFFGVVAALPLILYMFYSQRISGSFFTIYHIQNNWTTISPFPFSSFVHLFQDFRFTNIFQGIFWLFFAFYIVRYAKKLPLSLSLYTLLLLITAVSSGGMNSVIRYLAVIYGVFIVVAQAFKKEFSFLLFLFLNSAFLVIWILMFVNEFSFAT